MKRRTLVFGALAFALALGVAIAFRFDSPVFSRIYVKLAGEQSIQEVLQKYGPNARERLAPGFADAGISYPPARVTFVALKREKQLEVWAAKNGGWALVKSYSVCAASGHEGPKLREGDLQVPEGIYPLTVLNPNSGFHLSIRIEYPNAFDRAMAQREDRTDLGGDIYLHGNCVSIGCLAMGDEAIEELFVLVHDVGLKNTEMIIAPADLRRDSVTVTTNPALPWSDDLYNTIRAALAPFRSADGAR